MIILAETDNSERLINEWDGSGYVVEDQIYNAIKTTCIVYNTL